MEGKYVVVKKEAFDDMLVALSGSLTPVVGDALNNFASAFLEDAIVIRRQDVFAPPALDGYANGIMASVEAMKAMRPTDYSIINRLQEIANYFHEQAAISWDADRKLPD